jgi:hypothetical protein
LAGNNGDSGQPEPGVPWSIFQQGGGPGAAATWADDALREIGAPLTTGNEQVIYDWETSEGGGGWYNPLNQGDDPSDPSLTSTGSQYGGGAANYVSYSAGLKGFKDYMAMPDFSSISADLHANDPQQARTDIIDSPWAASHYDWGASFSDAALPGKKSALKGTGVSPTQAQTTSIISSLSGAGDVIGDLSSADFWERAGLIIFGAILIIVGLVIVSLPAASKAAGAVSKFSPGSIPAGSGGPTDEEREDRSRRLALAEKNTDIGAEKVRIQGMREARLANGKGSTS